MKGSVTARPVTIFGKRSPDRDYEWLGGRGAMPERIYSACEQVVRTSNETGALLSLVSEVEEETFLARTFRQGIDGAYRPILGLEVLRVDGELAPRDWPALARAALDERTLETAGSGEAISVELPASRSAGERLDGGVLDRIRLGLPVSVDTPEAARAILTEHPDRYQGVVFALRMRGGMPVPWRPELTPFLAIQCGQPVLGPEEEESLRLLERRRPSAEEWSQLSRVAPERVRRALRWALSPEENELPLESTEDSLIPWLVTFRRATAEGGELLELLQRDLAGAPLGLSILDEAFPDLSPAARAALADGADPSEGSSAEIDLPVLEELAARGLLGQGSPLSPRRWVHRARDSREVASAALALLRCCGIGEEWARVLLQLSSRRDAREVAEPDPGDLVLALGAWARIYSAPDTLALCAELLRRGWSTAVRAVLDAEERRDLPPLPPFAREVLRARVDGAPPPRVRSVKEVRPLVLQGLIGPGDVVPGEKDEELAAVADLWPETQPLAAVLRSAGGIPPRSSCPDVWLPSLRRALPPERAEAWLSRLGPSEVPVARGWLCQIHELPASVMGLFTLERPRRIDGATLRPVLPWVAALAGPADTDERIELLSRLARSRALEREDRQAADLVEELLPDADWEIKELAVHLLSRTGPLPPLSTIRPEVVAALAPSMDPIGLVNALVAGPNSTATASPQLADAVFLRVQMAGVSCPSHGYTAAQITRHPALVARLSKLEGWKTLAPLTLGQSPPAEEIETAGEIGHTGRDNAHE